MPTSAIDVATLSRPSGVAPLRAALVVLLFTSAACGGEGARTTGAGGGDGGTGAGGGGGQSAGNRFSVTFDSVTVNPGEEDTRCVVKRIGNTGAIHVDQIENALGPGSHHLIVYKTSDTVEQLTPFECKPFADLLKPEKGVPLMISQKTDDTLALPPGVGFEIEAEQMVRLEMHYINATSSPL
ncbi:MAG: hypothetical protein ABI134_19575, partial [Byssovorax sp.]